MVTYSVTIKPDDCSGDHVLAAHLKKVLRGFKSKDTKIRTAVGFLNYAFRMKADPLLKLKLLHHLREYPKRYMPPYKHPEKVFALIENQEETLLRRWWREQSKIFQTQHPDLQHRINAISRFRKTYPAGLKWRLRTALEKVMDTHLQELRAELAEFKRINRKGTSASTLKAQITESSLKRESALPKSDFAIRWTGSLAQLLYQFDLWQRNGLIAPESFKDRHKFVATMFINSSGVPFKKRSISLTEGNTITNKGRGDEEPRRPRDAQTLDRIASEINKIETSKPTESNT